MILVLVHFGIRKLIYLTTMQQVEGGLNMFYLRVKGTKDQFMRKDNPYEVTSDLSEAAAYQRQVHAVSRKQAYKASLGTIDRSTKKFEIITEEVARYGLASADRKLHV